MNIPIIGSLNGATFGGWIKYARAIEQAGADALELNIYSIPTDPGYAGRRYRNRIPHYPDVGESAVENSGRGEAQSRSSPISRISRAGLDHHGADALVLFNRFYQPDIELETLEITPNILLSTPMAMRLPMRWIAMLYGRIGANLAATSGIHRATDALKMLMAGADVTMLCSVLLRRGIGHIAVIEREMLRMDGGARIRIGRATQGQHEPEELPRPERVRTRAIHARALHLSETGHIQRVKVFVRHHFPLALHQKFTGSHNLLAVEPHIEIAAHAVDVCFGEPFGAGVLAVRITKCNVNAGNFLVL